MSKRLRTPQESKKMKILISRMNLDSSSWMDLLSSRPQTNLSTNNWIELKGNSLTKIAKNSWSWMKYRRIRMMDNSKRMEVKKRKRIIEEM